MKQRQILIIGFVSLGLSLALLVGLNARPGALAGVRDDRLAAQDAITPQDALESELPLGTVFTYQGQLTDHGEPVAGPCKRRISTRRDRDAHRCGAVRWSFRRES
jgi:hypothetical protein